MTYIWVVLHNVHRDLFHSALSILEANEDGSLLIKSKMNYAKGSTTLEKAVAALHEASKEIGTTDPIFIDDVSFDWDGYFPWEFTFSSKDWKHKADLKELLKDKFLRPEYNNDLKPTERLEV